MRSGIDLQLRNAVAPRTTAPVDLALAGACADRAPQALTLTALLRR